MPQALYLCGFLPCAYVQRRTVRNKRSVIPLNGVSRVRIPPPPLFSLAASPPWQHAAAFGFRSQLFPFGPRLAAQKDHCEQRLGLTLMARLRDALAEG